MHTPLHTPSPGNRPRLLVLGPTLAALLVALAAMLAHDPDRGRADALFALAVAVPALAIAWLVASGLQALALRRPAAPGAGHEPAACAGQDAEAGDTRPAQQDVMRLNAELERRVAQRTAAARERAQQEGQGAGQALK